MSDNTLDNKALDLLFREARSQNAYVNAPLTDDMLKELYDIWKYGPTSANCSPARVIFVRSEEGKAKLLPHLMGGNQEKTKSAAVCAIIGPKQTETMLSATSTPMPLPKRRTVSSSYERAPECAMAEVRTMIEK